MTFAVWCSGKGTIIYKEASQFCKKISADNRQDACSTTLFLSPFSIPMLAITVWFFQRWLAPTAFLWGLLVQTWLLTPDERDLVGASQCKNKTKNAPRVARQRCQAFCQLSIVNCSIPVFLLSLGDAPDLVIGRWGRSLCFFWRKAIATQSNCWYCLQWEDLQQVFLPLF